ncbi:MAG TPA: hypothetical protein VKA32_08465 [Gammaproteobacteria bacterium]|nr:hypothetical protein [Gammaproteobacteria bacterium]
MSERCHAPLVLALVLTATLLAACGGGSDSTGTPSAASVRGTAAQPLPPTDALAAAGAASDLTAEIACRADVRFEGLVTFSWSPAQSPGTEQVIQVTIFKDGFDTGQFESSKPLPSDQASLVFTDLRGQALHRWRVVTLTADTAIASETSRFTGPVCVGDIIADQPVPEIQ